MQYWGQPPITALASPCGVKTVQSCYSESRACAQGESGMIEWFVVEVGLRQGYMMSPWLVNMYMGGFVRDVNTRMWR